MSGQPRVFRCPIWLLLIHGSIFVWIAEDTEISWRFLGGIFLGAIVGFFRKKQTLWKSKDYFLNGFSVKTIVLVGIYNQQFKGTILFMVFDFQGTD